MFKAKVRRLYFFSFWEKTAAVRKQRSGKMLLYGSVGKEFGLAKLLCCRAELLS
ncbi:hypothetical protein [Candidatus Electronema sp. PJ]|uniref:hypothetical protein n=1 Tax=Candidatus Electronema sp. PJ TaxID=3401572 RepID=UPI003AA94F2A